LKYIKLFEQVIADLETETEKENFFEPGVITIPGWNLY